MKLFLAVLTVIVLNALYVSAVSDEEREMVTGLAESCRESEGASADDVEKMINAEMLETKEFKCLLTCLQEQFGIIEEGEFKVEMYMEYIKMKISEEDKLKIVEKIANEAKDLKHADRCEQGYMIAKHLLERSKEEGLNPS